ncbi:MAG: UDP-N-acetylmuramoyl-tripeptide--D-alanyl-D-alanine ligase [Ruminococcaceae bacterium]|nr:UDP-N-acetylmuramoyl-tripeptide--D-alanyl-D-alanine ligase [Oscillospiraceae bacterium]
MQQISIKEIICATGGTLLCGSEDIIIKNITTDSRKSGENMLFIALEGEVFDGHEFVGAAFDAGAVCALVHKDITVAGKALVRVEDTKKALSDLARYYLDKHRVSVVALTGSVGKTTTKDMVASVLQQKYNVLKTQGNFNNDIGLPLTVFNLDKEHDIAVLEMGMNHFGEIHHLASIAKPDKAIITNIGMSHIENLGSREGILKAKLEITDFFDKENTLFINGDDDMLIGAEGKYNCKTFGIDNENVAYRAADIVLNEDSCEFNVIYEDKKVHIRVNLPGKHNIYNALCAFCVAKSYDICDDMIAKGIASFSPSKMRMDIQKIGAVTVINDCYNASPASMEAALSVLCKIEAKRHVAILGDMLEMGSFAPDAHKGIGKKAANMGVDILFCVGKEARNIQSGAVSEGLDEKNTLHFEKNEELTGVLGKLLREGDAVLIKASRGMRFEQITQAIEKMF